MMILSSTYRFLRRGHTSSPARKPGAPHPSPLPLLPLRLLPFLLLPLLLLLAAGCGQSNISVYQVPKEDPWRAPQGWREREPGPMRVARFAVPGKNGRDAEVSLIPLKHLPGSRADVVNIWREQMHLPPIQDEELSKLAEKIPVSRSQGELFDMSSPSPAGGSDTPAPTNSPIRTLLAVLQQDQTTWFIKMTGDDAVVQQERPVFLGFLKTLNFDNMPAPAPLPRRSPHGDSDEPEPAHAELKPEWTIPPGWQEQPQPKMLLAKFRISGEGEARADVNISVEHGDGGGLLQNVNRWRGQLGLGPVEEAELGRLAQPLEVPDGKAVLVELGGTDVRTQQPARLIGILLPRGDKTWFYKLMGNEQIAEREKSAFIKFVQTAKYPNG